MTVSRYRLALNNARFPLVSTWGERAVSVPSLDVVARANRGFSGELIDFDVPQILYGENFVPVANGVKSVSYVRLIEPTIYRNFDQVFPLRDDLENTVLYSPAGGDNYVYDKDAGAWTMDPIANILTALSAQIAENSENTPETATVTRAYVDGKTFVCFSRLGARLTSDPAGDATFDASIYFWNPATQSLELVDITAGSGLITNLDIPIGEIDGISSSNGYLLIWSGLTPHWAVFNGSEFNYEIYANGNVTGSGSQIPEDIQGPITAIVPMSGGFILFTTKNAVAALYNANNFASPWIFKNIANAGGLDNFELAAVEGNTGGLYAYTTGGIQRITLNNAEDAFPDVTDFLGGRYIETFNTGNLTFEEGSTGAQFFVKVTYCGQRFFVISYGSYPGIYSFALIYDSSLQRWGKLRMPHRDCFSYSYGAEEADVTYNMLLDVSYDLLETELGDPAYDEMTITGGGLVYPRQSVAFLLETGEVKLAAMDYRAPDDDSEAFVVIGKNQLTRAKLATLHEAEIEGLQPGGQVAVWRSVNGSTLDTAEEGYLREQNGKFSEWGFDLPTGKNFTLFIKGDFALTTVVLHASTDGSF